ncbi:MAG: class I SAM-dependent methyltransferase [Myxococcales bacterium]|nr:class I SAM-dependent methyltransferase [Myxococcales bacterium]
MKSNTYGHGHGRIVAVGGLAVGLALLLYAPSLRVVSGALLLVAAVHVAGAVVVLGSVRALWSGRPGHAARVARRAGATETFQFGWTPGWMNGLWMAGLVLATGAVVVVVAAPAWWPLAFGLLLLGAGQVAGSRFLRKGLRADHVVLPMVDVVRGDRARILDAGCGTGRTTIVLGRILRGGSIVALDRFDAGYIEGGGRDLLAHNLRVAGLTDQVEIRTGDVTALPFPERSFDAATSAHMIDHLPGPARVRALEELRRVLVPGGRLLMVVWVPSWEMAATFNVLALLFLTSRRRWRELATGAGFRVVDEGVVNGAWFVVLERPDGRADEVAAGPRA